MPLAAQSLRPVRLVRACASRAAVRRLSGASVARYASTASAPPPSAGDARPGIGCLPLPPEEARAEQELLSMLPEFQQAVALLRGDSEAAAAPLPGSKRAELARAPLQRAVDICRSAMGPESAHLLAALRHQALALLASGDYAGARHAALERGELMQWPAAEHERLLRLLLRQNRPRDASDWRARERFAALMPAAAPAPLKWSIYELVGASLSGGADALAAAIDDPRLTRAVEALRDPPREAGDALAPREEPYLMAQFASLVAIASGALAPGALDSGASAKPALSDDQKHSLERAEGLWKHALTYTARSSDGGEAEAALAADPDAGFMAQVETNVGEALLALQRPEEAMEFLGRALETRKLEPDGGALGLARVLGSIAAGCHALGQAVSSEGLFTTAVEAFEKEAFLSPADQLEHARVLRAYARLLRDWEKREGDADKKRAQAEAIEQQVRQRCQDAGAASALHPLLYLPL